MFDKKKVQILIKFIKFKIIYLIYPFLKAKSLLEYLTSEFIFNKYDNPTSFLQLLIVTFLFLTIFISTSRLPILNDLKIYRSEKFSSFGSNIITGQCFTLLEIVVLRMWIFSLLLKHRSSDQIEFVKLLKKLTPRDEKVILFILKRLLTQITTSATVFNVTMMIIDEIYATNNWQKFTNLIDCIGYFFLLRIAIRDLIIIYALAIGGFKVVSRELDSFILMISEMDRPVKSMAKSYSDLVVSVRQLNSLVKILMFTGTFFTVPNSGFIIMLALIPADDFLTIYIKYTIMMIGVFFVIRGHFLTAILSNVDSKSKKLYSDINSTIARSKCNNLSQIIQLKLILDDISCERSLIEIREFNSSVTRTDFMNRIISTFSFVTLILSLKMSLNTH